MSAVSSAHARGSATFASDAARTLRRLAAALAVVLATVTPAGQPDASAQEAERDVGSESRAVERSGGWSVSAATWTDDRKRKAISSWVLTRHRPGGAEEVLRTDGDRSARPDNRAPQFRLNPSGWVALTIDGATSIFAPQDAKGVVRNDVVVTSASRFTAGGLLSVSTDESMRHSAAIRIAWAPLAGDTLKPAIVVARIDAEDARRVLAAAHVVVDETKDAAEIRWTLPGAGTVSGRARVDAKSGAVTVLPPPATVRVAAVQCPSDLGATAKNLDRIAALVDDAARGGAKFVVLPETAVHGYLSQDLKTVWQVPGMPRAAAFTTGLDPKDAAEPADGASVQRLGALAARWGLWLTVPILEVVESPRAAAGPARSYFNTVVLVGPDGAVAAHYRKLTPWPHPEQSWATPGDRGLATAETPYGRVGLAICFDVHEVFPRYAASEKKPWAMLYPVAWVSDGDDANWFGKELPRRAQEHGFHVVAANWSTDMPQTWHGAGFSTVISRNGAVLAKAVARTGSEIVFAELPLAE